MKLKDANYNLMPNEKFIGPENFFLSIADDGWLIISGDDKMITNFVRSDIDKDKSCNCNSGVLKFKL